VTIQKLISELCSGDDLRAEAAALEMAALPRPRHSEVLAALQELLAKPQSDLRWWAVRALSEIDHPGVPGLLLQALGDSDAAVRQCAALGLRLRPNLQAIPALSAALSDQDHLLASLAADALIAVGSPAVLPLLDVMQGSHQPARLKAARALATIGDTRAIPALYAALDEDSTLMEYWANEGLERMGVGMVYFVPE